jgi:predicted transposase YdaD
MSLAEQFRQEGRQEGLIFSKQQDILEALEIRFDRVPEGLREEIESLDDAVKLQALLRAAIRSATLDEFAEAL